MNAVTWTFLGFSGAVICLTLVVLIWIFTVSPEDQPPRFDVARARRESHALGIAFPESDGTLSYPPPTAEQVHERIHARRLAAQPAVGLTASEAASNLKANLGHLQLLGLGWHVDDCRCLNVSGLAGAGKLLTDPRCTLMVDEPD